MLPPRLIRRLVLAPLVIVIAFGFIVLSPFLALAALVSGLLAQPRAVPVRHHHSGPPAGTPGSDGMPRQARTIEIRGTATGQGLIWR